MITPPTLTSLPYKIPSVKKIFDYSIWGIFGALLILGGIIYVTDRTYPGDKLYPFKLQFENFVLATSKILNKQVDVSINMVMKRSDELTKVWSSGSAQVGLNSLNSQVDLTANSINQIQDPELKKLEAERYIAKLDEVSAALREKQAELAANSPQTNTVSSQTASSPVQYIQNQPAGTQQPAVQIIQPVQDSQGQTITSNTTSTSTNKPSTASSSLPTPSPTASTSETSTVSQQLNDTQQNIQQTITQMTSLTTNDISVTPTEVPTATTAPVVPTSPPPTLVPPTSIPSPTTHQFQNNGFTGSNSDVSSTPGQDQNNNWGWGHNHGYNGSSGSGF